LSLKSVSPLLPASDMLKSSIKGRRWSSDNLLIRVLPVILLLILLGLLAAFAPKFFTSRNIINIFVQSSTLGLMTMGMTLVMISGGIDLSIPAVMALSAIVGAMHLRDTNSILTACLLMLFVGSALGAINGLAVAYLKMIPFVVTLAMMTIAAGTSIWITNSVSVPITNDIYIESVRDTTLGIPRSVLVTAIVMIIMTVLLRRHLFGRWLYAVGVNIRAARISGVPTARVIFGTYVFSGFLAGLTATVLAARLGSASANTGNDGIVLDIVSSAVVGGVSIYGGVGGPLGAVFGAVFITIISNSMNLMQLSFFTGLIIKGIVIIGFVALESLRKR